MSLASPQFSLLKGRWTFTRSVNDQETMRGAASFSPLQEKAPSYLYREEGTYLPENLSSLSFFREYIYVLGNESIDVYFAAQGKKQHFFHRLDFVSYPHIITHHLCGDDLYTAIYSFLKPDKIILSYEIKGTKKNFTLQTLLTKDS